jgi:alpha-beta hydrolase superfamily lysophospholipase
MAALDISAGVLESPVPAPVRHNRVVRWRRLILLAVLLVVGASVVSALEPRDHTSDRSSDPAIAAAAAAPPAPMVEASMPADKDVRARVGDVVRLLVRAPAADVVQLPTLGVEGPVDANRPADLTFVADRPGRFRVRLRDAGESIGTVRVTG